MQLNPTRADIAKAAELWASKGADEVKTALKERIGEIEAVHGQLSEGYDWSKVTKIDGTADDKRNAFRLMNADAAALRDRMREIQGVDNSKEENDRSIEILARNGGSLPADAENRRAVNELLAMSPSDRERFAGTRFLRMAAEQAGIEVEGDGLGKDSIVAAISRMPRGAEDLSIPLDYLVGPRAPLNVLTGGAVPATGGGTTPGADGGFSIYPPMTDTVIPLPFPPTMVMDVVRRLRTNSNAYVYRYQSSEIQLDYADSDNAATKARKAGWRGENAAGQEIKPEWKTARSPVTKVLAYAEITEEQIEDGADVDGLVADQLRRELRNSVERDLLQGTGANDRMQGLLNGLPAGQSTAQGPGTGTVPTWGFDTIANAVNTIISDLWMMPDRIVMSPLAWDSLVTARDNDGRLQFMTEQAAAAKQVYGLPVVFSPYASATKAARDTTVAIGAFGTAGALVDRRDVLLARTDAHDENFTKDVVTIKASARVATARFYDKAFRLVTNFAGRRQP